MVKTVLLASVIVAVAFTIMTSSLSPKNTRSAVACSPSSLSGQFEMGEMLAYFEGTEIGVPSSATAASLSETGVLGAVAEINERWIEVDLSEQKLRAWDGDELYLETLISSGLPHTPTPTGEFRVWIKLRATKMEGGEGRYYYNLPNVPYVMFFENEQVPASKGYGLHGTYWHNAFGTPRSHGCVNLPTEVAEKLYYWTAPILPEGKAVVRASSENFGTRVIIHE